MNAAYLRCPNGPITEMTMLKLYYSPGACALASHIALEEAGADYTGEAIDLKSGQQRTPEYLAVNPLGTLPFMQARSFCLRDGCPS